MKRKLTVCICAILFMSIIIGTLVVNGVTSINSSLVNTMALENTYYVTQVIAAFCVVIGAFIGVWQYVLTTRAERNRLNLERIQKAIDLALYYKDNVLDKYKVIKYVFDQTNMTKVVQKVNRNQIRNFDEIELTNLLAGEHQKEIDEIKRSNEFIKAVLQADKIYNMHLNIEEDTMVVKNENEVIISIDKNAVVKKFMGQIVSDLLNNLEYFAMNFTHETADETVVYQSLHQTYLEVVYMMYYNVAISNKAKKGKYFTNIIELYNKWSKRSLEDLERRSNNIQAMTTKGNVVNGY